MNLIICTTPLQTLLAREIVKNYEDEKFYGILFSNHFSEKVDRYFNLFGVLCHVLNKIYCKSLIRLVCLILYYKIKFFNKKFDKIFVANIENILIQSIISSLKFNELITFDDGTANILKSSMLYQNNESWKLKFIKFIFMIDHDINTLKNISSLHYTIYYMDNIIKKTKRISIFNFNDSVGNALNGVLKICLGQRLYNDDAKNVDLFKKIIDKYNIDYYLPHPKESFIVDGVKYYDSDLIFEDIICNELNNYKEIYVYTIYSSAIINILGENRIHPVSIQVEGFEKESELMRKFDILVEKL